MKTRIAVALRRWWHNWLVADDEESADLDHREQRARGHVR